MAYIVMTYIAMAYIDTAYLAVAFRRIFAYESGCYCDISEHADGERRGPMSI